MCANNTCPDWTLKRVPKGYKLKPGNVIFVEGRYIDRFCVQKLQFLKEPFILITHNSDKPAPISHLSRKLLRHPLLIRWFARNPSMFHPKLHPVPIGLCNLNQKNIALPWKLARQLQSVLPRFEPLQKVQRGKERTRLVYMNYKVMVLNLHFILVVVLLLEMLLLFVFVLLLLLFFFFFLLLLLFVVLLFIFFLLLLLLFVVLLFLLLFVVLLIATVVVVVVVAVVVVVVVVVVAAAAVCYCCCCCCCCHCCCCCCCCHCCHWCCCCCRFCVCRRRCCCCCRHRCCCSNHTNIYFSTSR